MAYLGGGGTGRCPPLWPEHKNCLNTLNQKKIKKFLGRGHSPLPRPLLQWGGDTPPQWRLRRLEPRVFGSGPPSQNPKYATVNNGFWTDHGAGAHLRGAGADQRGRTALGAPVHAGVEAAPPGCSSCVVAQPYVLPSQWSRSPGM